MCYNVTNNCVLLINFIVDTILNFEYKALQTINTPIKVPVLADWLQKLGYNKTETDFLVKVFSSRFDLEYEGHTE